MDEANSQETAQPKPPPLKVHIRWMIRRDMPEVLAIESCRGKRAWTEDQLVELLRQRNAIGMVAEHGDTIVGYMAYTMHKTRLEIRTLAVHEKHRLRRVGWQMLAKAIGKLQPQRREAVRLNVREADLDAQLWLKACGFRATAVEREHFDDDEPVAYRFEYALPRDDRAAPRAQGVGNAEA